MDDHTPDTPESTPDEGLRPEADPSVVRPDEAEPNGPVEGLVEAAATEVMAEISGDPAIEAEAEALGVEGEGVESGQIMGLVIATIISVLIIVLSIVFLFYLPALNETEDEIADVPAERYLELRENRTEGLSLISEYATDANDPTVYRIPIASAMAQMVEEAGAADGDGAFMSATDFNLSWISLAPAPAIQSADDESAGNGVVTPVDDAAVEDAEAGTTDADATDSAPEEAASEEE